MSVQTEPKSPTKAGAVKPRRQDGSDRRVMGSAHILLALWAAIVILPMLWTLMSSFKTDTEIFSSPFALPGEVYLDNYVRRSEERRVGKECRCRGSPDGGREVRVLRDRLWSGED